MKPSIAIVALALCTAAHAADITLTDGRTLRDAKILSQAPATVTIRHADGFSQVEKSKLPPDLAALYPVDEAAAEAQRQAELARAEKLTTEQAAKAARLKAESGQGKAAARHTPQALEAQQIRNAVGAYIQKRFNRWKRTSAKSWSFGSPQYQLGDPMPVPGAAEQWTVSGTVAPRSGEPEQSITATVAIVHGGYRVIQAEFR